jgi:FkbM family methyltransferase
MRIIKLIFRDFRGLVRVCGFLIALRWLLAIGMHLPECRRRGNLAPADEVFGDGPIRTRRGNVTALMIGPCILTGIREIWVRNIYLSGGFLTVPDNGVFLDLGAGTGLFTMQAVTSAKNVSGFSVEAEIDRCEQIQKVLGLNNIKTDVKVINAFVGGPTTFGREFRANAANQQVPVLSQRDLLDQINVKRIDLLKCDIEGSEFGLFTAQNDLLAITQQLALELHPDSGDAEALIASIQAMGFETNIHPQGPTFILLARRPVQPK